MSLSVGQQQVVSSSGNSAVCLLVSSLVGQP